MIGLGPIFRLDGDWISIYGIPTIIHWNLRYPIRALHLLHLLRVALCGAATGPPLPQRLVSDLSRRTDDEEWSVRDILVISKKAIDLGRLRAA